MIIKKLIFLILLITYTLSYSQDTIYIDPTFLGTSSGSITNPYKGWRDFSWVSASDGNVYLQKRGTTWTGGGITPDGNNIKMGAYGTGHKPIINCNSEGSTAKAVDLYRVDGFTIENLEFMSIYDITTALAIGNDVNPIVIDSCIIHDVTYGIRGFNAPAKITIKNTEIYNTADDGIFTENTGDIEIYNSYIHHVNDEDIGGDCIQLTGEQGRLYIHDNFLDHSTHGNKFCLIVGSAYVSNDPDPDSVYVWNNTMIGFISDTFPTTGIYLKTSVAHLSAWNNNFISCATGMWLDESTTAYNNLFKNCSQAITLTSGDTLYASNNIFMGNRIGLETNYSTYGRLFNNIFIAGPATTSYYTEFGNILLDYNSYSIEGTGLFNGANTLASRVSSTGDEDSSFIAYPIFVDSLNNDYHLSAESPLIGKGTSVAYRTVDKDTVAVGVTSDIGIYEYTGGYIPTDPCAGLIVTVESSIISDTNNTGVGSINLTIPEASYPYSYLWSNSAITQDIYNLITDVYTVLISFNGTCDTSLSFTVSNIAVEAVVTDSISLNYTLTGYNESGFTPISSVPETYTFNLNNNTVDFVNANWTSGISSSGSSVSLWDSVGRYYVYSSSTKSVYFNNLPSGYYKLQTLQSKTFLTNRMQIVSINDVVMDSIDAGSNTSILTIDSVQPDINNTLKITFSKSVANTGNIYLNGLILKYLVPQINVCDTTVIDITGITYADTNNSKLGKLDITVSNGTSPYTYLWSNDSTTQDLDSLVVGTYFVTVTDDNGCIGTESFNISNVIHIPPSALDSISISYSTVDYPTTNFYIISTDDQSHIFYMGTDTITYIDANWTNITYPGNESSSWGSAGRYYAYSTSSKSVYFTNVDDAYYEIKVLCSRSYYTNRWEMIYVNDIFIDSVDVGGSNEIITLSLLQPDINGTIKLTFSEPLSATSNNVYINALVLKEQTVSQCDTTNIILSATIVNDRYSLGIGSISISPAGGAAPYTYLWSNSATSSSITGLSSGTYEVTVTDNNSCESIYSYTIYNRKRNVCFLLRINNDLLPNYNSYLINIF